MECPLLTVEQTWFRGRVTTVFDPKQTSRKSSMASTDLPVHVTETHHFPDSGIADIFYQLAVDEALELHVAGEAQVRTIEPRQLGQEILESASSVDELVVDDRF